MILREERIVCERKKIIIEKRKRILVSKKEKDGEVLPYEVPEGRTERCDHVEGRQMNHGVTSCVSGHKFKISVS